MAVDTSKQIPLLVPGSSDAISRFDGTSWSFETLPDYNAVSPTSIEIRDLFYVSSAEIYACGTNAAVYQYDGTTWLDINTGLSSSGNITINEISKDVVTGKIFCAVDDASDASNHSKVFLYDAIGSIQNSTYWNEYARPGGSTGTGHEVGRALSQTRVLIGDSAVNDLFHFDSSDLSFVQIFDGTPGSYDPVFAKSIKFDNGSVWIASRQTIIWYTSSLDGADGGFHRRFDCGDWYYTPPNDTYGANGVAFWAYGIWGTGDDDIWVGGVDVLGAPSGSNARGNIYHWNGSEWESGSFRDSPDLAGAVTGADIRMIGGTSDGENSYIYAFGYDGSTPLGYFYDGVEWGWIDPQPTFDYIHSGDPANILVLPVSVNSLLPCSDPIIDSDHGFNYYSCLKSQHSHGSSAVQTVPFVFAHKGSHLRKAQIGSTASLA